MWSLLLLLGTLSTDDAQRQRTTCGGCIPLQRVGTSPVAYGADTVTRTPIYRATPYNPSQELQAFGGVQWLGLLEIGEPRQRFTVAMDTGSSDLLVIGRDCQDKECTAGTVPKCKYDSAKSTSFSPCRTNRSSGCSFKEEYGGGNAMGVFGVDVVVLSGLRAPQFEFGIIKSLSMDGAGLHAWDGILGLTFDNEESGRPKTLLSALYAEGALSARQLTFMLMDPAGDGDDMSTFHRASKATDKSMLEIGGMTMVPDKTSIL